MKKKRILCAVLAVCMLAGTLAGCGSGPDGGDKPMGRFVERQGEVLGGVQQIYQVFQGDAGALVFYGCGTAPGGTQSIYQRYVLPKGGEQTEATPLAWLNTLTDGGDMTLKSISEGPDGTVYALLTQGDRSVLYRSVNGGAGERVEVPDWQEPGESGGMASVSGGVSVGAASSTGGDFEGFDFVPYGGGGGKTPFEIIALEDGFLAAFGPEGVSRYSADGNLTARYVGEAYRRGVAVSGDTLLMKELGGKDLLAYSLSTNRQSGSYTYDNLSFETIVGLDAEGVYVADATGIYRQAKDGSIWERLVEGDLTSLAMPNQVLVGISSDGEGGFCGILQSDETYQIMRYVFDPDTPTAPDTELSIFSLKDNSTVRQAIGEFQRRNPNVRVNFRVAMADDSAATAEDVIRALNTELLAGKGPDLLLLDGLPLESYIEKGVLADMSDLAAAQGLMPNLMSAYERDGKKYGVPTRFGFPVMMGDTERMAEITSLNALLEQVRAHQGEKPPLLRASDNLWMDDGMLMDYFDASAGQFLREGAVDEAALTDYLTAVTELNRIMREHTPQLDAAIAAIVVSASGSSGYELTSMGPKNLADGLARLHIQDLSGRMNLHNILMNLGDRAGMELGTLFGGDSFQPMGGVGIVSSGKQQDLARSFVEMLLSPTVQDKYLYDGFAVNGGSLEKMVKAVTTETRTGDMGFLDLCKGLSTPILIDQVVKDAVAGQVAGLLDGSVTPRQAAAEVVEKTKIYLAE